MPAGYWLLWQQSMRSDGYGPRRCSRRPSRSRLLEEASDYVSAEQYSDQKITLHGPSGLLRNLLENPVHEVRLGLLDAEALELGCNLSSMVSSVIDDVAQDCPRG